MRLPTTFSKMIVLHLMPWAGGLNLGSCIETHNPSILLACSHLSEFIPPLPQAFESRAIHCSSDVCREIRRYRTIQEKISRTSGEDTTSSLLNKAQGQSERRSCCVMIPSSLNYVY